jgi:uncharacterized membrane protein YedE/YeeE
MEDLEVYKLVNILAFAVGIIFGAISQKSQFCFNGSIKDYINNRSKKRAASIVVAMISAIITTFLMAEYYDIDLSSTVYLKQKINYFTIIIGGVLFGLGMVISDGCTARHMVKFSSGDTYSLIPLLFIAISAFATIKGILNPVLMPFLSNETLLDISSNLSNFVVNIYFVLIVLFAVLILLVKDDLKSIFSLYDGIIIGALVAVMWYVTGYLGADSFERTISLGSLSFIYSSGETLQTLTDYTSYNLKYSVVLIFGIFCGAFLMSLMQKKESLCCTVNGSQNKKLRSKIIGGILMGIGGVFALGCTIGQGLTGISTLAFSSFIAIGSILITVYVTLLVQKRKSTQDQ